MDRGVNVAHTAAMDRKSGDGLALSGATLPAIGRAFDAGRLTAERLVRHCLDRIEAYDRRGPRINAVINLNPKALERARELDREREQGGARGSLHGVPVVVKDTIDVAGMPTTGGFTALAESYPVRDAAAVRRLHDAGAVVLAKVNANDWFGTAPMSASTLGGQTLNPHHLDYVPGGSSCGTGAALAASYAPLGLGTDASGSVLMPAADSGVLGLIPSRGLVSRAGSMCMAPTIGRLGIMARSAFDLAALLTCLAGWDPEDLTTSEALPWFPRHPYESQLAATPWSTCSAATGSTRCCSPTAWLAPAAWGKAESTAPTAWPPTPACRRRSSGRPHRGRPADRGATHRPPLRRDYAPATGAPARPGRRRREAAGHHAAAPGQGPLTYSRQMRRTPRASWGEFHRKS